VSENFLSATVSYQRSFADFLRVYSCPFAVLFFAFFVLFRGYSFLAIRATP
jgi:hypothetical protein